jgi:light-regulated signal transduction histidine kinase (bacteriophytochrome)
VADPVGFLVNLFAHAPVGFAVWSADGHTLLTNAAFMDLFGSEPPPEYNVLEDDQLAKNGMLSLFQRAFAGETVHVPTFWYDPRDLEVIKVTEGRRVAISMTIFPLFKPSGEIDYVAATYKNETEVRTLAESLERMVEERTAQYQAANQELEAFSYSVAHDLRAPLRGMAGFAGVLLDEHKDGLDAEARSYLQRIDASATLMGQLIDALLSLSRVTRSELHPQRTDLSDLARSAAAMLAAGEPERRVDVVVSAGLAANVDRTLARTLLDNLVGNAWKFTRQVASARIEVGATQVEGAPAFYVRDNGAGFDMRYASRLFAPFQRLHAASDFPGTGIGLATCRRIVDRHRGRLWGEARVGQGATFYFTLPAAE